MTAAARPPRRHLARRLLGLLLLATVLVLAMAWVIGWPLQPVPMEAAPNPGLSIEPATPWGFTPPGRGTRP